MWGSWWQCCCDTSTTIFSLDTNLAPQGSSAGLSQLLHSVSRLDFPVQGCQHAGAMVLTSNERGRGSERKWWISRKIDEKLADEQENTEKENLLPVHV